MPTSIAGDISDSMQMLNTLDGEVWTFSVHEFGDVRNSCADVGPALVTENNIADVTIAAPADPTLAQMFTQDDFMQDIGSIIGHSIKVSTMRQGNPATVGCCVVGKGMPVEVDNGGGVP